MSNNFNSGLIDNLINLNFIINNQKVFPPPPKTKNLFRTYRRKGKIHKVKNDLK